MTSSSLCYMSDSFSVEFLFCCFEVNWTTNCLIKLSLDDLRCTSNVSVLIWDVHCVHVILEFHLLLVTCILHSSFFTEKHHVLQFPQSESNNNQRRTYLTFAILTRKIIELHVFLMQHHDRNQKLSVAYNALSALLTIRRLQNKNKINQTRKYKSNTCALI